MLAGLEAELTRLDGLLAPLDDADLSTDNVRAWQDWMDLHLSRPVGMGVGAIPYTEIQARLALLGRAPEPGQVERIRVIDGEFLTHHAAEREAEKKKQPARAAPSASGPRQRRR